MAVAALAIAAYLFYVSVALGGQALGCGAGGGCSEVLMSPWSKVLGIPVGGPAVVVYGLMLGTLLTVRPGSTLATHRASWGVLAVLAGMVLSSALWFVGLQAFVLKAFCPWCLADHALGATLSIVILWTLFRAAGTLPDGEDEDSAAHDPDLDVAPFAAAPFPRAAVACLAGAGLSVSTFLMALQLAFPSAGPPVQRLAESGNADSGPGPGRRIVVMGGKLELTPHDLPIIGSPDAPKLLVVMFDYCCPHCRRLHAWLDVARERYPDQFAVVLLPTPQNPRCHPGLEDLEPRFEHACELARLALGVWRADRSRFAEFDQWLFESEDPRSPDAAQGKAESLVSPAALASAMSDPWIDARIRANVGAYRQGGVDRIPVILSPGFSAIVGRPSDEDVL
ncbi:MAG: hypothetical protein IT428_30275, partial [Planctomycetaceae bacterium]|nr:hypothetical protein [Planctomycetaceae bacterium]